MVHGNVFVHHKGERGVDGILRLIELAGHDGPLEAMLTAMCDELAAIAAVDVASIYVCEGDGALVMRGNHGLAASAIGTVLAVGEGLTGLVAECMRPVSAARAAAEAAYKHVPGIGEERFPVYAGIPLIGGGAVIGVLVLQRRERALSSDEVTLATALGAPVTLAIERRRAAAVRSARLVGRGHAGAIVLGRAAVVPTSTALGALAAGPNDLERKPHGGGARSTAAGGAEIERKPHGGGARSTAAGGAEIDRALARLRDDLGRAVRRLGDAADPQVGATLDRLALALCDARLRERLDAAAGRPDGLRAVAKEYARASYRVGAGDAAAERTAEIEELCALVGASADPRAALRPGAVWLADRIGGFVAIAAVARGASALVAADAPSPAAIAIARAADVPLVGEVAGLFGWARAGDLLAVDGAAGTVLVHPAADQIERLRRTG